MVARVTLAEVDAVRMSIDAALEIYRTSVIPALHEQDGYQGCYVLTTPEGKAMVLTLWDDEDAAEAGLASGHYSAQVGKFVTFYHAPPGREMYDVGIADLPAARSDGVRP
jgi:heme-degrading monooxygenase HmoA